MAEKTPKDAGEIDSEDTITAQQAADLLMLESVRRVQQLTDGGYIERAVRGRYYTRSVIQGYIRFLKEVNKDRQQNTHANRVQDARAKEIEMRNAKASHQLIEYSEAESVVLEIAGMLKSNLTGLGARVTRDMPMRRKIEAGVDDIFSRTTQRITQTLSALRESGQVVDTDSEDEPG